MSIVPAVIPHSLAHAETLLASLQGAARSIQIDIVDGRFVPFRSWPYREDGSRSSFVELNQLAGQYDIELDLMVEHPENVLHECLSSGARRIIIHIESTSRAEDLVTLIKKGGCLAGIALNNDTDLGLAESLAESIDFLQCMGIAQIGAQGFPFDERVLGRIQTLRKKFPALEIAVDGGVRETTIPKLKVAGASRLISGSAIFQAPDPRAAYCALSSLYLSS